MPSNIVDITIRFTGLADTLLPGIYGANLCDDGELMFSALVLIALNGNLNWFGWNEGVGFAQQLQEHPNTLHPLQHWMLSDCFWYIYVFNIPKNEILKMQKNQNKYEYEKMGVYIFRRMEEFSLFWFKYWGGFCWALVTRYWLLNMLCQHISWYIISYHWILYLCKWAMRIYNMLSYSRVSKALLGFFFNFRTFNNS